MGYMCRACGVHVGCMWRACGIHVEGMWDACGVMWTTCGMHEYKTAMKNTPLFGQCGF